MGWQRGFLSGVTRTMVVALLEGSKFHTSFTNVVLRRRRLLLIHTSNSNLPYSLSTVIKLRSDLEIGRGRRKINVAILS